MEKYYVSWEEIFERLRPIDKTMSVIYGIPKGGMIASAFLKVARVTHDPEKATHILDDICDSGNTFKQYSKVHPSAKLYALFDKQIQDHKLLENKWLVFPWEAEHPAGEDNVQQNIIRQLEYIGENINREGLKDTPDRVIRSWNEIYKGYSQQPEDIMTIFNSDGYADKFDEIILLKDIEMYSMCLAGSTFIETPKGRIPISKLKDGEYVYCYDEDNCRMTLSKAKNPRITGKNKRLWRVYSDKDTILCTGNHKFLTHTRGWVEAQNLIPGDSIIALNKGTILHGDIPRTYFSFTGKKREIPEHRFVYEEIYGKINKKHHIHHIDKQPNNNNPENLKCLLNTKHNSLHRKEDGPTGFALFTKSQRQAMKEKQIKGIQNSQTEEVKAKRSASLKTYWSKLSIEEKNARNHRILLVEKTDWFEDVWCMDIPKYHNFIANGMVVHNCEHHMLPFFGKAHVAYIPNDKIVGISKLARLVDIFARRLQIQEKIGASVTEAIMRILQPKGAACIIEAEHMCMRMRGVAKQNSMMVTSSMKGVFLDKPAAREELMQLIKR